SLAEQLSIKKKAPIKDKTLYNIGLFNKGQASKIIRKVSEDDETALILKNGEPLAVLISQDKHKRLMEQGIDLNEI
uniref:type II toxin-antitoxin system prevent-host-death family antitoxin n=1 Tax=Anaerococcus octavius TaxID=54007 RepID=UPI003734F562